MSIFGPPPSMTVNEALYTVFTHYSQPYSSSMAVAGGLDAAEEDATLAPAMEASEFARLIRDAPGLAKNIGRAEVDLIFSSVKGARAHRLDYESFLDALVELAVRIFPDADPLTALSNFLARFIFALFDQPPAASSMNVIEKIIIELQVNQA
jgi:hypothetical protein